MPLIQRKRRAPAEETSTSPPPTRRRRSPSPSESSSSAADSVASSAEPTQDSTHDALVKKLVRLALASEYARQPLRRADINAKVLAPSSTRLFKPIFASAQTQLRSTFGMMLTALPTREKITIAQKRAAQRATGTSQGSTSTSSQAWVVTSTLPSSLRMPAVLAPGKAPDQASEASYVALYTFVIGVIYLTEGGMVSEGKMERVLGRVNAGEYFGGEKMEKVVKRMEREGYVVKVREREGAGGEERVDWVVGPRGKVEVGEKGVAGLVRAVYGSGRAGRDQLEERLVRSLGEGVASGGRRREEEGSSGGEGEGSGGEEEQGRRVSGRGRRRREADEDGEEESEDD